MNYKDAFLLIAKCLTIHHEAHNRLYIKKFFLEEHIEWDKIVAVSTEHFVFPALYLSLKKADLLKHLPEDLVAYMIHITDLNRERNQQIIKQAKDINALLKKNGITPIFLKGTGNLLEGLYEDIGARMIGDIDFIVDPESYIQSSEILQQNGYRKNRKYEFPNFKHFPRMHHPEGIAAVELHKEFTVEKYAKAFNYHLIKDNIQVSEDIAVLGYTDQYRLTALSKHINDNGLNYKHIYLRNAYDIFLLSKKCDTKKAISEFGNLQEPCNRFTMTCHKIFGGVESIHFDHTNDAQEHVNQVFFYLENEEKKNKHFRKTGKKIIWKLRWQAIEKTITSKVHRKWMLKRMMDKDWQQEKLVEFGLKNRRN